jgi:hypothetical protein
MDWIPQLEEHAELEYRVAVLEGLVRWLLSNAYLDQPIEASDLNEIYRKAEVAVRARFPQVEISYEELPSGRTGKIFPE